MVPVPGKIFEILNTAGTQNMCIIIMGKNPSCFKLDALPVEQVSWDDAIEFCNSLSKKFDLISVYTINGKNVTQNTSANGFRLPAFDEWQYAAKGGKNYTYAGSDNIDEVAWYGNNSRNTTHPVAQKKPNGYGLYDMSGNVWEWCWDPDSDNRRRSFRGGSVWERAAWCKVNT